MFDKKIPGVIGAIKRHGAVLFPRLTPRRLANMCRAYYEMRRGVARVRSRPFMAKIEASSACNLSCDGCRSGNALFGYSSGNLKVENFECMLEKLSPYLIEVLLYLWGEPLINKNLPLLVRAAHQRNVTASISTNLHYLSEEMGRGLIDSQLDKMVFCIDGLTPETYGSVRKGGRLELALENVERFVKLRRRLASRKPYLEWQYIVTEKTRPELDDAKNLARNWGVERFVEIVDWSRRLHGDEHYFRGLRKARERMRRATSCYWLWTSISVQYDGGVFPCCHTASKNEERRVFGNLIRDDLESVWNSPRYLHARRSFSRRQEKDHEWSGAKLETICDDCSTPPVFSEGTAGNRR